MTGINHVAGGTVFTALFASFFNVNIFSSPLYITATIVFSVLPDIDHTRSVAGKAVYPLALWIDKRFGHRTITHSFIFFLSLAIVVSFIESFFVQSKNITLIFCFAYMSHLIFDMMTVSGIPFFYPFRRNPCVIPGNPSLRLSGKNLKTETIVFCAFVVLGITCKNLFVNGFWSSYNNLYNSTKHVSQTFQNSNVFLSAKYNYIEKGKNISGSGLLMSANDNTVFIYDSLKHDIIEINKSKKIIQLQTTKTNIPNRSEDVFFSDISFDSLNVLLKDKIMLVLRLQSNERFAIKTGNNSKTGTAIEIQNCINPAFSISDSSNMLIQQQLELIDYEIIKTTSENISLQQTFNRITSRINEINNQLGNLSNYEREKATDERNKLKREIENISLSKDVVGLQLRRKQLIERLNKKITVSGYFTYL
jgi:inner membrane protein